MEKFNLLSDDRKQAVEKFIVLLLEKQKEYDSLPLESVLECSKCAVSSLREADQKSVITGLLGYS